MIFKTLSRTLLLMLILVVSFVLYMVLTHHGQSILLNEASLWANNKTDYQIDYDAFEGNLLSRFSFTHLTVKQNQENLLSAKRADVQWDINPLFQGKVLVEKASFDQLFISDAIKKHLKNDQQKSSENKKQSTFDLKQLKLPAVEVKDLSASLLFMDKQYFLEGKLDLANFALSLLVQDDKKAPYIQLSTRQNQQDIQVDLKYIEKDPLLVADLFELDTDYLPIEANVLVNIKNFEALDIKRLEAKMHSAVITAKGQVDKKINIEYDLKNFRFKDFKLPQDELQQASVRSNGKINGPLLNPNIDLDLSIKDIKAPTKTPHPQMLDVNAQIKSDAKDIHITSVIRQDGNELSTLRAKMPRTEIENIVQNQQIQLQLQTQSDIDTLRKFFSVEQKVSGHIETDMKIAGKISEPSITGDIKLQKGVFEEPQYNLKLSDIQSLIRIQDKLIIIESLSAKDSQKGRITAEGTVHISTEDKNALNLQTNINEFYLLDGKLYQGLVNGEVRVVGPLLMPEIKGALNFDQVKIQLPDTIPQGTAKINTVSKQEYEQKKEQAAEKKQQNEQAFKAKLDVGLNFPKRIFVRGQGLDAELGGNLTLKGDSQQPIIDGQVNVIRGQYKFLDKLFKISKGHVTIHDQDIYLDFTANAQFQDMQVTINVTGRPEKIKIKLASSPSMPEDQILAKILFNKDITSLTPLQSLKLANALRKLTGHGGGGGLDLLGSTRDFLKLDELNVETDDAGDPSVGVGKYIGDNIYIKGSQGTSAESTKFSVNIDVTKNITIESSTGVGSQNNDIKIFWKKDY